MKQITFLFLILLSIGCSTTKKTNQKSFKPQPEKVLIKNVSDTTIRLPRGTSQAVWAGNTLYVSGSLDPDMKLHTTNLKTLQIICMLYYKYFKLPNFLLFCVQLA